jgi:DNA-binding MarR family transcriptional regulator
MLDYLRSVFGADVREEISHLPPNAPFYLRDNYSTKKLSWRDNSFLLLKPKNDSIHLPALKKHLKTASSLSNMPCALELENMTSLQRKNLMESQTPFISDRQQIYLPFWGCLFTENYKKNVTLGDFAPITQLVFLYLYYQKNEVRITASELSEMLSVSKASVTRVIDALSAHGLIRIESDGYRKWVTEALEKREMLRKALPLMKSPVERTLYVNVLPPDMQFVTGGIRALSQLTMLGAKEMDGSFVIDRMSYPRVPKESIVDENTFRDLGGSVIEVWSYNPRLLSTVNTVDEISLLLSLMSNPDERVQMALDEIRAKFGLATDES